MQAIALNIVLVSVAALVAVGCLVLAVLIVVLAFFYIREVLREDVEA